jgi:hypothetical protein
MALIEANKTRPMSMHDEEPRAAEVLELREALKLIYDLLEDYAPSWYGEKIRDKAEAALRGDGRERETRMRAE